MSDKTLNAWKIAALLKDRTRREIRERARAVGKPKHLEIAEDYGVPVEFVDVVASWQMFADEPSPSQPSERPEPLKADPWSQRWMSAECLWEDIGVCLCRATDVSHWCESCQGKIDTISAFLGGYASRLTAKLSEVDAAHAAEQATHAEEVRQLTASFERMVEMEIAAVERAEKAEAELAHYQRIYRAADTEVDCLTEKIEKIEAQAVPKPDRRQKDRP